LDLNDAMATSTRIIESQADLDFTGSECSAPGLGESKTPAYQRIRRTARPPWLQPSAITSLNSNEHVGFVVDGSGVLGG